MTSFVSWVGVDRKPGSLYIASDSRLTWTERIGERPIRRWDSGPKVFASRQTADVFGYWGFTEFPSQILLTMLDQINAGALLRADQAAAIRHQIVCEVIRVAFDNQHGERPPGAFTIVHGARDGELMQSRSAFGRLAIIPIEIGSTEKYRFPKTSRRLSCMAAPAPV